MTSLRQKVKRENGRALTPEGKQQPAGYWPRTVARDGQSEGSLVQ